MQEILYVLKPNSVGLSCQFRLRWCPIAKQLVRA